MSDDTPTIDEAIGALKLRGIGPAFMGGRISDIAIHPDEPSTWYVSAGSGGVWKTTNSGTTWTAIFEDQGTYSIGCLAVDPQQPSVIWVGTGESVSGRHVAWGDGVYRSDDGGSTWTNTGLNRSEHIGTIAVDPRNSDRVFVAAEGPLWSSGGQRGVYRTDDRGATWQSVLSIDDDTGVTSLVMAPDNPDIIYAAAYQRRRHVATFVGGGAGSGIYKSSDGGTTWKRLTQGLPKEPMGKIGLAVTPADPNLVFATIEGEKSERGFHRSIDRGESWERRNEYISGGTGPHYYQEIFASPVDPERIYQVDVFLHVTGDGGKTFDIVETAKNKHSDNHVVWIDPERPKHLLVGTDAGLYETFDDCLTFRHVSNLPLSQFYRVAVSTDKPFYAVMAGAQDLGTLLGPSRTTSVEGVRNQDWTVPLGADGYHVAFHPTDPNVCYLEWQVGNVTRLDRRSGEIQDIQPQPAPGEPPERWNWDTPIVVSAHDPDRLYLASQRVWRSDNRGRSWTAISPDLTTDRNRYELASFGAIPSVDSLYDHLAMSWFSTISHVDESALDDGLLYVGTDDGRIHRSDDGGSNWVELTRPTGLPGDAFVNNIRADRHDADTVYLAADDHKHGDFTPRLYRSRDRGSSWDLIVNGLPEHTIVWALQQDHANPELLFIGTEFGLYTSLDQGDEWHKLSGDVPTIAFRDITIHREDSDLIGASFGRGIYILDDYGPLRSLTSETVEQEAALLPVRAAIWYIPHNTAQAEGQPTLGSTAFKADNPAFGATITYHLREKLEGPKGARRKAEKDVGAGQDIAFPGWDNLREEEISADPVVALLISDECGNPVRRFDVPNEAGLHRVSWDLRRVGPTPLTAEKPGFKAPWDVEEKGPLAPPGRYSAELVAVENGEVRSLSPSQPFEVIAADIAHDSGDSDFDLRLDRLARLAAGTRKQLESARRQLPLFRRTALQTPGGEDLLSRVETLHRQLEQHWTSLVGDPVKERLGDPADQGISSMINRVAGFHWFTTQAPTDTQVEAVNRAETAYEEVRQAINETLAELDVLSAEIQDAGGTWTQR